MKNSTAKNSDPPTTEIAFILDRSGSMQSLAEAAIAGFNRFLRDQQAGEKEGEGHARLTLILFDDEYLVPADNLPVSEVVSLDASTYTPRATTALLDAIGLTIGAFKKRHKALPKAKRPNKVIFAILTDGYENASVKHTWIDIARKIRKRREKDGWEFLFLGANQDAIATAAQMNIDAANAATFRNDKCSVRASSGAFSRKIRAMRRETAGRAIAEDTDHHMPMADLLAEEQNVGDRDEEV